MSPPNTLVVYTRGVIQDVLVVIHRDIQDSLHVYGSWHLFATRRVLERDIRAVACVPLIVLNYRLFCIESPSLISSPVTSSANDIDSLLGGEAAQDLCECLSDVLDETTGLCGE